MYQTTYKGFYICITLNKCVNTYIYVSLLSSMEKSISDMYEEIFDGLTDCPDCGASIEIDGECSCGGVSEYLQEGLI